MSRYTDTGEEIEHPRRLRDQDFLILAAQEIIEEGELGMPPRHPTTEWTRHVLRALVAALRKGGR